jgi:hypothetical protein
MNTIETDPSNNARDSEVWSRSWTHFTVDRRSPRHCHVTFDHSRRDLVFPGGRGKCVRNCCLGQFWKAEVVCGVQEYAESRRLGFGSHEQAQCLGEGAG